MLLTTFPREKDFDCAIETLRSLGLSYEVIYPTPGYRFVGIPAVVVEEKVVEQLASSAAGEFSCSGWVDFNPTGRLVPADEPEIFAEDVIGNVAVMVLAACVADLTKIRLIAHVSGQLEGVFPYLNAEMPSACFNPGGPSLVFMEGYRMITLYPGRIAVAKADDIVDAWRVLEKVRRLVNGSWQHRAVLTPCYERRQKPPAIEIYKRLPATNCGACGEATCLAFALRVWNGEVSAYECRPVFEGTFGHLKEALLDSCSSVGARIETQE